MAIQISKPPSFGEWLKEWRKAHDLTQAELARQIGCAEVTLRKIETGAQRPSKSMALRLAEVLEIDSTEQEAFVAFARAESTPGLQPRPAMHPRWSNSDSAKNLPSQPTPLIGREREIAAISKRILHDNQRLVTLTGAPGVGKTSLAIEVAGEIAHHFSDGICYAPLATTQDASLVPSVLCQSLRLQESGLTATERLKLYLGEKHLLIVLDNFEHLLSASAWVAELLASCPWLTILVTSRAPLRVRIERQVPILPLGLPPLAQHPTL
jgi:transcriptional regulator with XRE-family HTH domain